MIMYAVERNGKFLGWNNYKEQYEWMKNIHPDGLFVDENDVIALTGEYPGSIIRQYELTEITKPKVALALVA